MLLRNKTSNQFQENDIWSKWHGLTFWDPKHMIWKSSPFLVLQACSPWSSWDVFPWQGLSFDLTGGSQGFRGPALLSSGRSAEQSPGPRWSYRLWLGLQGSVLGSPKCTKFHINKYTYKVDMTISMIIIISESALKTVKVRQSSDPWETELHVQKGHVPSTRAQQGAFKWFLCNNPCVTHICIS